MADRAGTSSSATAGAGGSVHSPRAPAADEVEDLLDSIINTDVSKIVMTTDEMDEAMASLEARNNQFRSAMETGEFVEWVLETLMATNMWLDVAGYLGKCVRYHATESVLPVPDGTQPENVHAQLFLSPHTMYAFELVASGDRAGARSHYNQYLAPLRASCDNGYVRNLFTKVELTIKGTLYDFPNMAEARRKATVEIKDYLFLYFPNLKPKLRLPSGREPSPIWMFGEPGHREEDGARVLLLPPGRLELRLQPPEEPPGRPAWHGPLPGGGAVYSRSSGGHPSSLVY